MWVEIGRPDMTFLKHIYNIQQIYIKKINFIWMVHVTTSVIICQMLVYKFVQKLFLQLRKNKETKQSFWVNDIFSETKDFECLNCQDIKFMSKS